MSIRLLIAILLFITSLNLQAQVSADNSNNNSSVYDLTRIHSIELNAGLLSSYTAGTEVTLNGVTTKSSSKGFLGALAYTYWFNGSTGLNVSIGASSVNAEVSSGITGASVESATVIPFLIGIKYQPFTITTRNDIRPYLYLLAGPYIGIASDVKAGLTTGVESYTETALGSRIAAGLDISLSRLFTLGFSAGYRAVTDFERRIGTEKNHSTPDFTLNFGVNIR